MIRKAKAATGETNISKAADDDFMAFDLGDDSGDTASSDDEVVLVGRDKWSKASQTRFSHLDNLHPNRNQPPLVADNVRPYPVYEIEDSPPPPPPHDTRVDTWPPPPPPPAQEAPRKDRVTKRGRKRGAEEYEEDRYWAACPVTPSWRLVSDVSYGISSPPC